jgi:hypothetical protein
VLGFDSLLRVLDSVERLPEWARPIAYGPLFIAGLMMAKGVLVVGPVLLVIVLLRSHQPAHDVRTGLVVLAIAFISSAIGGLFYTLFGRPLNRVFSLGWLIAGWLAFFPYVYGVVLILRMSRGEQVIGALAGAEWATVAIMTLIFGSQIGYMILRPGAMD